MTRKPRVPTKNLDAAPSPAQSADEHQILPADKAEHEIVEVTSADEHWSTYTLADGTVVRVKPVIAEFVRVVGQYDESGEPLYLMRGGIFPSLRVPKNLWRK